MYSPLNYPVDIDTMKVSPQKHSLRGPRYGGVKSIDFACRLLEVLSRRDSSALKDLSDDTCTTPAKVHRYLSSLVRGGLVDRDPVTRRYALGPLAFQIGLRSMRAQDSLESAVKVQAVLRDRLDETTVLCVWSDQGPTVIHVEESSKPILMTIRVGAILPVLSTATGLVFAAYLPTALTQQLINVELLHRNRQASEVRSAKDVRTLLASVRRQGFAVNNENLMPGVCAFAIPMLDFSGQLVAVLSVITREQLTNQSKAVFEAVKCVRGHMRG